MLELMRTLGRFLEKEGVRYLIFGGIAGVRYGSPRATFDLDVVLDKGTIKEDFLEKLDAAGFSQVEGKTFREFVGNAYTIVSCGFGRADLWIKPDGFTFDEKAWARRSMEDIDGISVCFMSPEDLVASKLAINQTELDEIDVLSVLLTKSQKNDFDYRYFGERVKQHKLQGKVKQLAKRIGKIAENGEFKADLDRIREELKKRH
ncbi:MAG: hypothetical protein V1744_05435 [Candidatus Altiarchaeota archaeon]